MKDTSKIRQLPEAVQRELNLRIQRGQGAPGILAWLSELPEARAALAAIGAKPVIPQNLYKYRHSAAYLRWETEQEAAAAEAVEIDLAGRFAAAYLRKLYPAEVVRAIGELVAPAGSGPAPICLTDIPLGLEAPRVAADKLKSLFPPRCITRLAAYLLDTQPNGHPATQTTR